MKKLLSLTLAAVLIIGSFFIGLQQGREEAQKTVVSKSKTETAATSYAENQIDPSSTVSEIQQQIEFVLPSGEKISGEDLDAHNWDEEAESLSEEDVSEEILPFQEEAQEIFEKSSNILESRDEEVELATEEFFATRFAALGSSFEEDIEDLFYNAVVGSKDKIDISDYKIACTGENRKIIYDVLQAYIDKYPELYNVSDFKLFYTDAGYYSSIRLSYHYTASQYSKMNEAIEKAVDTHFNDILSNDDLSDLELALLVHDRLALLCEYDQENYETWVYYNNLANEAYVNYLNADDTQKNQYKKQYDDYTKLATDAVPPDSYNMYGTLILGVSVCQGYAKTYQYILNQAGVDSYLCASLSLNHVWNIVEIDEKLYHVDVTWDDPVYDTYGQVYHNNFLVSSSKLYSSHRANDYDVTPDDTTYDNYFWQNSHSAFVFLDGEIYYIDSGASEGGYGTIYLWNNSESDTRIYNIAEKWIVSGSYYGTSFSKLAASGCSLYFSTSDTIFALTPNGEPKRVFEPQDAHLENSLIYGFKISNGNGIVQLRKDPFAEDFISESFPLSGNPKFDLSVHEFYTEPGGSINLSILNFDANGTAAKPVDAEWSSSDTNVATVDETGNVEVLKVGFATITCKILDTEIHCYVYSLAPDELPFSETTIKLSSISDKTYLGKAITPSITVYDNSKLLQNGTDYTLSYKNNINVGEAQIIIKGAGVYVGEIRTTFKIKPYNISETLPSALQNYLSKKSYTYSGKAIIPDIDLSLGDRSFIKGTDYELSYKNNINAGEATVSVKGLGNYQGSATAKFTIKRRAIKSASVVGVGDKSYTGKAISLNIRLTLEGKNLLLGKDFVASYTNNKKAGKATVEISGIGNYDGSISKYFYIHPAKVKGLSFKSATKSSVKISWKKSETASGYAVLRATSKSGKYKTLKIIESSKTLNYTDKTVGAGKTYYYKVIAFKTVSSVRYTSVSSEILKTVSAPKAPKIKSNSNKSGKKAYLSWSKASGSSGYKVYMSTKKSSGFKAVYTGSKISFTKKSLKKKKTYYFKIKAYKTIGSKKIYSEYSKRVSIKIKK